MYQKFTIYEIRAGNVWESPATDQYNKYIIYKYSQSPPPNWSAIFKVRGSNFVGSFVTLFLAFSQKLIV
jgi:hypothetical protein